MRAIGIRRWASSLALLLCVVATSPAKAEGSFAERIRAIEADPNETLFETHYITSNERHHAATLPYIDTQGGVFIGIGTDQNFELIPHLAPTHVVMIDFDQWVVDAHAIYAHLFRTRETPRAFINFFQDERLSVKRRELKTLAETPRQARSFDRVFMRYRGEILKRLMDARTRNAGRTHKHYLSDQGAYEQLRTLVLAGRYVALRADLTGTKSLRALARVLRALRLEVNAISFSNAEQYFGYGPYFRANMRAFDYTPNALILRTFRDQGRHYDYYLQSASAFLDWLEDPKASRLGRVMKARIATPHPRVFTLPGMSRCRSGLCAPAQGCGELLHQGCCRGKRLDWCLAGRLQSMSCAESSPPQCGWSSQSETFVCGGADTAPLSFEMMCPDAQ